MSLIIYGFLSVVHIGRVIQLWKTFMFTLNNTTKGIPVTLPKIFHLPTKKKEEPLMSRDLYSECIMNTPENK